jgi:hypothetical protein
VPRIVAAFARGEWLATAKKSEKLGVNSLFSILEYRKNELL